MLPPGIRIQSSLKSKAANAICLAQREDRAYLLSRRKCTRFRMLRLLFPSTYFAHRIADAHGIAKIDVFGVLAANLENRIHVRGKVRRAGGMGRNLDRKSVV